MDRQGQELLNDYLLRWEELFEQGNDVEASDLCKDHPELTETLARRIAILKASSWLDKPLEHRQDPPSDNPTNSPLSPKTLLGRYLLDEHIGTGGSSEVWRAYDQELQRTVAVKLPKLSNVEATDRFLSEARRVARLKHPAIVPVYDVGLEDGRCFIVTEYIDGGSLADRLGKGPVPQESVIRWISSIADALEYAHIHGVIHRDIKPENILISVSGQAVLADFGIAQSSHAGGASATSLGTLKYMSPEAVEGRPITPATDIYSLGVVLHEALAGEAPYSGEDVNVLRREIVLGAAKGVSQELTPALHEFCQKALQRDPTLRHSSAAQFATELRAVGSSKPPRRYGFVLIPMAVLGLVGALLLPRMLTDGRKIDPPAESLPTVNAVAVEAAPPSVPAAAPLVEAKPAPVPRSVSNSLEMLFVQIPPGEFQMGEGKESVKVTLSQSYWIGTTEVSQLTWKRIMGTEPWKGQRFTSIGDNIPATYISWDDAVAFCDKITEIEQKAGMPLNESYRLPTEAEWEYACRAGSTTLYHFGDDPALLSEYAWHDGPGGLKQGYQVHPIATKKPNAWGLYDMHGNASEWCSDWYLSLQDGEPLTKDGGKTRVLRGATFFNQEHDCRSARRDHGSDGRTASGFRVARSLK